MSTETVSNPKDTSIFQTLESYPWDNDGEYQIGLNAILGQATDASQIQELTLRAQVFYLARKKNIPIDFDAYKAYLVSKSNKEPLSKSNLTLPSNYQKGPPESKQSTTEKRETFPPQQLLSSTPMQSSNTPATTASDPSTAPYPPTFAEIVALITSGASIPGIKDIPSTLIPEKATKPVATKRRKPWETDVPEDVVQGLTEGTFGDRRDEVIVQELPE